QASSPDGLTFARPRGPNLSGNDPALVMLPNGRLLMYYDSGVPSKINAAVATRVTAPAVSYPSPAATAITATSARVSAIVDPNGAATTYAFEYGRSTGYGDGTGVAPVPGTSGQLTVSATLTGLSPATTYHFRVDAYNSVGSTNGADQTFKTGACPLGAQRDRGWEVALGHAVTRTGALRALRRARTLRRSGALVERDGCTDYEAALT